MAPSDIRTFEPQLSAFVKNTFLNIVDPSEDAPQLRRSASDGDVSKSSSESQPEQAYFLPSLWSSSQSGDSGDSSRILAASRNPDGNAPWLRSLAPVLAANGAATSQQSQQAVVEPSRAMGASPAPQVPSRTFGMLQGGPPAASRLAEPALTEYEPSSAIPSAESGVPTNAVVSAAFWGQPHAQATQAFSSSPASAPAHLRGMLMQPGLAAVPATEESGADFRLSSAEDSMLVHRINEEMKGKISLEKLEEMVQGGTLACIPRNANGELSSVGSIHHPTGACTPCAYWFKGLCKYSICCHYCHFAHNGQKSKRLRPSKQTRMRIRRWEAQRTPGDASGPPADIPLDGFDDSGEDDAFDKEARRADHLESLWI